MSKIDKNKKPVSYALHLRGIPLQATRDEMARVMSNFGRVLSVSGNDEQNSNYISNQGTTVVRFETKEAYNAALEFYNGYEGSTKKPAAQLGTRCIQSSRFDPTLRSQSF